MRRMSWNRRKYFASMWTLGNQSNLRFSARRWEEAGVSQKMRTIGLVYLWSLWSQLRDDMWQCQIRHSTLPNNLWRKAWMWTSMPAPVSLSIGVYVVWTNRCMVRTHIFFFYSFKLSTLQRWQSFVQAQVWKDSILWTCMWKTMPWFRKMSSMQQEM